MKRRQFLRNIAPLVTVPFFANRLGASVLMDNPALRAMLPEGYNEDRILVVLQMKGGNDGLNTILPIDQYTNLAVARPTILIPESQGLSLDGLNATKFHPAMSGMQGLFNNDKLSIIQGVSYPNPDFSHFRSTDIWNSASDSDVYLNTGWLGRFLDYSYSGYPSNYPNTEMPDPLALQIDSFLSFGLQGPVTNMAQTLPIDFNGELGQLIIGGLTPEPAGPSGIELAYIRSQQSLANEYANRLIEAWNAGNNAITYPAPPIGADNDQLAQQLRIVARLIKGGLKTRIYFVTLGGFDTHDGQVISSNDTTHGLHATLLQELSDSIAAFQEDLGLLGIENRVLGMTFSEFGRRIGDNDLGTDHGEGAPMFLFGAKVNPGMYGTNPIIQQGAGIGDNVPMQFDFRRVYKSILEQWFCLGTNDAESVLLNNVPSMPILNSPCTCAPLTITGDAVACGDGTSIYTTESIPNMIYNWQVTGGTIISGQGTNQISIKWNNDTAGNVTVTGSL